VIGIAGWLRRCPGNAPVASRRRPDELDTFRQRATIDDAERLRMPAFPGRVTDVVESGITRLLGRARRPRLERTAAEPVPRPIGGGSGLRGPGGEAVSTMAPGRVTEDLLEHRCGVGMDLDNGDLVACLVGVDDFDQVGHALSLVSESAAGTIASGVLGQLGSAPSA
jgi:hypothetical protein